MEKVIRDGKVAVLYSSGFGAGWYTWNTDHPECIFDPEIVATVERRAEAKEIERVAEAKYGGENSYFYAGGADGLTITWIPQGEEFYIHEYDGSESIR